MQPYQQRVLEELQALQEKLGALHSYISKSDHFKTLSEVNQDLLIEQHDIMNVYANILKVRISFFD